MWNETCDDMGSECNDWIHGMGSEYNDWIHDMGSEYSDWIHGMGSEYSDWILCSFCPNRLHTLYHYLSSYPFVNKSIPFFYRTAFPLFLFHSFFSHFFCFSPFFTLSLPVLFSPQVCRSFVGYLLLPKGIRLYQIQY